MTVTKLVRLDEDSNRRVYGWQIDKLPSGLRVYGIIFFKYIVRSVNDTSELQSVKIYYQTQ